MIRLAGRSVPDASPQTTRNMISRLSARSAPALAAIALAAALAAPAPAQTSYPLVCRGGPTMRLAPEVAGGSARVLIRFARAARGAVLGVEPGTCAWQDRGINSAEPAVLCFARADHVGFEMNAAREVVALRVRAWAGDRPVIFWEGGEEPDGAALRIGDSGEHWYLRAYNDPSRGCLMVSQVGP
jgi:hypothetical protein